MSEEESQAMIRVPSARFGELEVPADSVIELPTGLIGFSQSQSFIMLEHKPPFSWLQSVEDPSLAFVIVDGAEFGEEYQVNAPYGDTDIDLQKDDDFAILVVVTVRSDARDTTANLKAPVFVNLRNKKGVQIIFDNPNYSTRFPLWADDSEGSATPDADPKTGVEEK